MNGVKKAIVSTGIGALIVAVGMLIAHFDDLRKMFKKDNPVEEADKRFKELETSIDKSNAEIEREIELMEAAGVSTQEVIDKKIELLKVQKSLVVAEGLYIKSQIDEIEKHGKIRRLIAGENKDLEDLNKRYKELYQQDQKYIELIADAENSKEADKIRKRKAAADEEKKQLDEILKRVKENSKSEIQALTDKYNEEYTLLKKHGKDTTELTKQYNDNIRKTAGQTIESLYSRLEEYFPEEALSRRFGKAIDLVYKFQEAVDSKFPPDGLIEVSDVTEEIIEKSNKLGLTILNIPKGIKKGSEEYKELFKKAQEEFVLAYRLAYQEYKKIDEEFLNTIFKQTEAYRKSEKELSKLKEGTAEWYQGNVTLAASVSKNISDAIDLVRDELDHADTPESFNKAAESIQQIRKNIKEWEEALYNANEELDEATDSLEKFNNEQQRAIEIANNETDILEKEFGKDSWTQWFSNTSQFYKIYDARLKAAEWYRDNLEVIEGETNEERKKRELEAEQAILQIKREYAKKQIEVSQTLSNGLISVWGSINDIRENNLKAQGEKDKDIFEKTKGSRIAQATVDTIAGSLAAFMGWQEYPQPYAAIMGGIQAAATLAAGMAQIAQIRATQFNDAGQNISNPQAVVNATPRMADYSPDLVSNITGASDTDYLKNALQETPIYVSVTDIDNAQVRVTDRNRESSF